MGLPTVMPDALKAAQPRFIKSYYLNFARKER
jgi:hypothetical protein